MSYQAADKHKTVTLRPCQIILLRFDEHILKNNVEDVISTKFSKAQIHHILLTQAFLHRNKDYQFDRNSSESHKQTSNCVNVLNP